MERRKLWQIPQQYRLEVINLALVSNGSRMASVMKEAINFMDIVDLLDSENTFSRSMQKKLDLLFSSSIDIFSQAGSRWGLRLIWCGHECAQQPCRYIWAFATHPCASESLIDHACLCARCLDQHAEKITPG